MMRLGLLTSLWQRHELARVVMQHHARITIPGIEIVPVAVGSEGCVTRDLAHECGWHYVEAPNSPLSNKMNAGISAFSMSGVDAVAIIGSDDLVNAAYFEHVAAQMASGIEAVELRGIYFYDAPTDRLVYADAWSTGVGRCLSSALLKRIEWKGWRDGDERRLDHSMRHQAIVHARPTSWIADLRATDVRVVDIKTPVNMWTWDWCVQEVTRPDRRHPVPDTRAWFERHFPGTYDDIFALSHPTPEPQTA